MRLILTYLITVFSSSIIALHYYLPIVIIFRSITVIIIIIITYAIIAIAYVSSNYKSQPPCRNVIYVFMNVTICTQPRPSSRYYRDVR